MTHEKERDQTQQGHGDPATDVQLLAASPTSSALVEEKTGSALPMVLTFIPLDLLIPLWEMLPGDITLAPFPLLQNHYKIFHNKEVKTTYTALRGTLTQKNEVK